MSEDRRTSWTAPNTAYQDALGAFVAGTLADRGFLDDLEAFVAPLAAHIVAFSRRENVVTGLPRLVWSLGGD